MEPGQSLRLCHDNAALWTVSICSGNMVLSWPAFQETLWLGRLQHLFTDFFLDSHSA